MNIVFISRQSDSIPTDFQMLIDKLERGNTHVFVSCKRVTNSPISILKYLPEMIKQILYIRKADVVILDSYCIPISLFPFKNCPEVIQIWHAVGLMKKTGYSIIDAKEGGRSAFLAKIMKMHKNYDYIFASSKACFPAIAELFKYPEEKIIHQVLPRIDLLSDKEYKSETKKEICDKYPKLKNGKKNILYAPTWRTDNDIFAKKIRELENVIDYNKYNLIVKLHPLTKIETHNQNAIVINEYNATELAFVSDVCITDYSSVLYEFLLLGKPTYFYDFDINEYDVNRGFYIDYIKEIPGGVKRTAEEIYRAIEEGNFDYEEALAFAKKYVDIPAQGCTESIVDFILRTR